MAKHMAKQKHAHFAKQKDTRNKRTPRLEQPRVPSAALSGMPDCYKIKLQTIGFRLVYQVQDDVLLVTAVAVGKRDGSRVYVDAKDRLD